MAQMELALENTLSVRVSNSLKAIDPKEWGEVFASPLKGYNYFRAMEESLADQFKFYYLSFYEGPEILSIAPCFLMDFSLHTTVAGTLKKLMRGAEDWIPQLLKPRFLICGSPIGGGNIGIKTSAPAYTLDFLVKEMRSIAEKEKAQLLAFKDFSDDYDLLFKPLLTMGFHKVPSYPSVELNLRWKSFDEYLASLSHATRKDLKRKFRKAGEEATIRLEVRSAVGGMLEEVYRLYLNTFEKSEVQFEKVTKNFFKRISEYMPHETKYFLWYLGERLVAFDLCLTSKDQLIDEYIGLDYDAAYKYHLYFITFRDIFNWCIQNGIRRYESSALDYEPKKRLDLTFVPEYFYLKHVNPAGNLLFGLLSGLLKPDNFDPLLKPKKKNDADDEA